MSITGIEAFQAAVGRWSPEDLAFIEQVSIVREAERSQITVKMIALFQSRVLVEGGWPDPTSPFHRAVMEFSGARSVKICFPESGQVMGFTIDDISDRNLEGLRYRVGDYEDNRISFQCKDVSVRVEGSTSIVES